MDQVGILFNSASQAETPTRDADFKNLLHLVSTLLDAIKEKIVIESEDIKKILI
jgi:hypothetical protein